MVAVDTPAWAYVDDLSFEELDALLEAEQIDVWESDPATLTSWGLAEGLRQVQEQRSRLAAREAEFLRALVGAAQQVREVTIEDDRGEARTVDVVDEAVESAATAMRQSIGTVRRRITVARALANLPATRAALGDGMISPEHAEVIARIADGLPGDRVAAFEARVLRRARLSTPAQTASFARRVRALVDGAGEERRRQQALRHLDVRIWAEDDGLACLQARLPLADALRVHAALEAGARQVPFDPDESMGQRRVRALVSALCGPGTSSGAPTGEGVRTTVEVQVTVDLPSLLGLAEGIAEVAVPGQGREPMGLGALRGLLADAQTPVTLRRLVTEAVTGRVIDRGRTAYRVSDALRAFLIARDPTCRFPLCSRSSVDCDMDHVKAWSDGGPTDAANLMPLCRRHHVLKTHTGWSVVEQRDDGTVMWRAPDGREVVSVAWNAGPEPAGAVERGSPRPQDGDGFPF